MKYQFKGNLYSLQVRSNTVSIGWGVNTFYLNFYPKDSLKGVCFNGEFDFMLCTRVSLMILVFTITE